MITDDKDHFPSANQRLPSLKESDYWAETLNNMAVFRGIYLDHGFRMRYSFKTRDWIGLDDEEPFRGYADLLKWELSLHEKWLPRTDPPTMA